MESHAKAGGMLLLLAAFASVLLSGCSNPRVTEMQPVKPDMMKETCPPAAPAYQHYTLGRFYGDREDYRNAMRAAAEDLVKNPKASPEQAKNIYAAARVYRDIMINRIRADIRASSGEFEDHLRQNIALWDTGMDFAEYGLSLATTVAGGEQVKTVLGAISTAVKGAHTSVNKNFFREKTMEVILQSLRASRIKHDTDIVNKMSKMGPDEYPFEEAWTDLVDLYYAGTLASGFENMAEDAGAKTTEEKKNKDDVTTKRIERSGPVEDEIKLRRRITLAIGSMKDDLAQKMRDELVAKKVLVDDNALKDPKEFLLSRMSDLPTGDPALKYYQNALDDLLGKGKW